MQLKAIHILLVEDNEGDILLTREAFEDAKVHILLSVVRDGKAAVTFLNDAWSSAEPDLPDIILLDVNLPKMNGHEVLKYIKTSEPFRHIPVVMLTTTSHEKDVYEAYHHYVNSYITKPVEISDFLSVVTSMEHFWLTIVKLPSTH